MKIKCPMRKECGVPIVRGVFRNEKNFLRKFCKSKNNWINCLHYRDRLRNNHFTDFWTHIADFRNSWTHIACR
jgi:hypothetical protein